MRILLVESFSRHVKALGAGLKTEGLIVEPASTGEDAINLLRHYEFDLVLLNVALPDMEGSFLISRIRSAGHQTPVLALTSLPQARIKSLAAGADDVVEPDVDRAELVARIRAIVRRTRGYSRSTLQVGALSLDVDNQGVTANGQSLHFTAREFAILQLLVLRRNMILTKEAILSSLYGGMDEPEVKIIDVYVCKIRSKLIKAGLDKVISTVWGRGYTIRDGAGEGQAATLRRVKPSVCPENAQASA